MCEALFLYFHGNHHVESHRVAVTLVADAYVEHFAVVVLVDDVTFVEVCSQCITLCVNDLDSRGIPDNTQQFL